MLRAIPLALGDLADKKILRVLLLSLLITLALFAGLGILLGHALAGADPCGLLGLDACPLDPRAGAFSAILLTLIGIWLLFPAVAIGVVGLFCERVIAAIEARHYPGALATARHPGQIEIAWLGLRAGLRLLLYNLIALPFYLLLLVTGVGPLILFLLVNAVAVGRDLFEMVAIRHLPHAARREMLAATRGERFLLGLVVTGLFMIPLANLFAPVFGAALAAHLFHGRTT